MVTSMNGPAYKINVDSTATVHGTRLISLIKTFHYLTKATLKLIVKLMNHS